jgi:hypothetical protein
MAPLIDPMQDLEELAQAARTQLGLESDHALVEAPTAIEEALRRAHHRVAHEMDVIDDAVRTGKAIDYAKLFEALYHEKIASVILLTRYTLYDLAANEYTVLDYEYAHRDVTVFAELLFRTNAVEGLGTLYDFATEQGTQATGEAVPFWQNIALHTLLFLALVPNNRAYAIPFILERPYVAGQFKQLASSTGASVSDQLKQLFIECRQALAGTRPAPPAPAPYMRQYTQIDPDLPYDDQTGLCAVIVAEHRIHQAIENSDMASVVRWFSQGSAGSARVAMHAMRTALPSRNYARQLEQALHMESTSLVRQAAAILELGALNRKERPVGGDAELNRILFEAAMTEDPQRLSIARLAAAEMGTVGNQPGLLIVAEEAPQLDAAGAAIYALWDMRRLLMAEPVVRRRPELMPYYRNARAIMTEVQNVLDAIWSTDDAEQIENMLARLIALKAWPELQNVNQLAARSSKFGQKAMMLLHQHAAPKG